MQANFVRMRGLTPFAFPIVALDAAHSGNLELRWWLLGKVKGKVLTVRYTHRPNGVIRIFGAAWWREGKKRYEEANGIT